MILFSLPKYANLIKIFMIKNLWYNLILKKIFIELSRINYNINFN